MGNNSYDDDSRLVQIDFFPDVATADGGVASKTVAFSYDGNSNLTGYDDGATVGSYTFDNRDRLVSTTVNFGPFSKSYSYTYYKNGLKKTFTDPEDVTYAYSYDANNQFQSVDIPGEGSITVNSYQWGMPAQITLPGGGTQNYTYDSLLRYKRILSQLPDSSVLMDYQYAYDDVGNITEKQTEHGSYVYGYDAADRLVSADNPVLADETFTYDVVGNRLTDAKTGTQLWQYNDRDELLSQGITSYSYDANGSMMEENKGGALTSYNYDLENRLDEVRDQNNALVVQYDYDTMGRRISKTEGLQITYFLYADEGLIAEYNQSGIVLRSYGYQPQSGYGTQPLWLNEGGFSFYHRDHLGIPQKLSDQTNVVVWEAEYGAFGQIQIVISGKTNQLRFPGQYFDVETGLHYNYFRDYDPNTGRYVQSDPIGLAGGINTYAYVGGNPLVRRDPFGLAGDYIFREDPDPKNVTKLGCVWDRVYCYEKCVSDFDECDSFCMDVGRKKCKKKYPSKRIKYRRCEATAINICEAQKKVNVLCITIYDGCVYRCEKAEACECP